MPIDWKSFVRSGRDDHAVRIIWAERSPDLCEIHVPIKGQPVLYHNGTEVETNSDVLALTRRAEEIFAEDLKSAA